MDTLPTSFAALAVLALVLGLRHGLDADHLAVTDALARLHGPRGRWCGAWFALGHATVVLAVVLVLGAVHARWQVPAWMQAAGRAVSLVFLLGLGGLNLLALARTPRGQVVPLAGLRPPGLLSRLQARHPAWAAAVGALFAVSFDTLSQAVLFAVAGAPHGPLAAGALALLFGAGMLLVDGFSGWWVGWLAAGPGDRAARISWWTSLAVAGVALALAGWGLARALSTRLDAWAEPHAGLASVFVLLALALGWAAARWQSRRAKPALA